MKTETPSTASLQELIHVTEAMLDILSSNRLLLGEYMGPEYIAEISKRAMRALAAATPPSRFLPLYRFDERTPEHGAQILVFDEGDQGWEPPYCSVAHQAPDAFYLTVGNARFDAEPSSLWCPLSTLSSR